MKRPEICRYPNKTWLTQIQAIQKAEQYGMKWYPCYDHFHIGRTRRQKREERWA